MNNRLENALLNKSHVNNHITANLGCTPSLLNPKERNKREKDKFYNIKSSFPLSGEIKNSQSFVNNNYLKEVKNKQQKKILLNNGREIRDIGSEIDYSDVKSAAMSVRSSNRKYVKTPGMSQLTNGNLLKFEKDLQQKSSIKKGGGGSIYSDVRSQLSKYKNKLKELSVKSKNLSKNHKINNVDEEIEKTE